MHKNKAADQAWERYKAENSHVPHRSLRKREFIAGWMARAQYQPSVLDDLLRAEIQMEVARG